MSDNEDGVLSKFGFKVERTSDSLSPWDKKTSGWRRGDELLPEPKYLRGENEDSYHLDYEVLSRWMYEHTDSRDILIPSGSDVCREIGVDPNNWTRLIHSLCAGGYAETLRKNTYRIYPRVLTYQQMKARQEGKNKVVNGKDLSSFFNRD